MMLGNKPFSIALMLSTLISLMDIQPLLASDEIWNALGEGGKVILMRHLPVDEGDPLSRDESCLKEQNVSESGKLLGKKLAAQLATQNIPIGDVFSSPYCRTRQTAQLVFGHVKPMEILVLNEVLDNESAEKNQQAVAELIGSYSGQNNLVLVSHQPNISKLTFEMPAKGAFIVLAPQGGSDYEEVGMIKP